MIQFTQFKISNLSGANITLASLDNFLLTAGATDIDIFSAANGDFRMPDVVNNTEIETLLAAGSISCKEENDLNIGTVVPVFGQILTECNPPTINATQDDYTPTGWANARYVNLDPNGTQFISGFGATFHGDIKIIRNNTTNSAVFLLNNASGSLPENRVLCSENTTFALKKYSSIQIMYDETLQRWVTIAMEKP
jgi:hypothetical protein